MSISRRFPLSFATAVCVTASPALAELTVDDAWNTWKAQFTALGLNVEATETREGDALQIGPLTLAADFPMDAGSITLGFAGPRFEPLRDGTVQMSLPDEGVLNVAAAIKGEGSLSMVLDVSMENNTALLSGTPEEIKSVGSVDAAELNLVSLSMDGEAVEKASGRMSMQSYRYENNTTIGDDVTIEGSGEYDGYDLSYAFEMVEEGTVASISNEGAVEGMKMSHRLVLPAEGVDLFNLHQHLRDGLEIVAKGSSSTYKMTQTARLNGELLSHQSTEAENYFQSATINQSGVDWRASTGVFSASMELAELPAPIMLSGASGDAHLQMPVLSTGTPQDAALEMGLQEFTLNDELWALADPGGQFPRDPMELRLDLGGQIELTHDLADFATLAELEPGTSPVVPVSADLRTFLLSAVGAELTGNGAFTFDASDTTSFPGMPRPEGSLDLRLSGGNALLDRLVEIGIIPEDQAMGARMMMGMFMVPGQGEDELTSQIEINSEGHVLANGQRLK